MTGLSPVAIEYVQLQHITMRSSEDCGLWLTWIFVQIGTFPISMATYDFWYKHRQRTNPVCYNESFSHRFTISYIFTILMWITYSFIQLALYPCTAVHQFFYEVKKIVTFMIAPFHELSWDFPKNGSTKF